MEINGTTKVIAHLAYPSKHLRTPLFFNPLCEQQGRNAVLVPWQVHPDQLDAAWEGLRQVESLAGVLVTIPHKTAAARLCDRLEGVSKLLGVVNAARRLPDGRFVGRIFDGLGFVHGLGKAGHSIAGKRVLLVGAGGAATSIAHALIESGVESLTITNRSPEKADQLVNLLQREFPGRRLRAGDNHTGGYDIVINGTSLGMKADDPVPFSADTLESGTLVAEVIMQPDETVFLKQAAARGCVIHKGHHMITGQIELLAAFLLDDALDGPD
ncbi:MAG: shikimate dehydrogenase [Rhodobacter sp.]|nr:shikimate dehydrogenase [Rhodobacter sp.]